MSTEAGPPKVETAATRATAGPPILPTAAMREAAGPLTGTPVLAFWLGYGIWLKYFSGILPK